MKQASFKIDDKNNNLTEDIINKLEMLKNNTNQNTNQNTNHNTNQNTSKKPIKLVENIYYFN
jgi:hypothetical protein